MLMTTKTPLGPGVTLRFPPPPIAPTLIPSSNYSPSSRRFSAKSPHILSRTAHSPSQASAKLSSGVSTKSPEPNAPHTLQIQDTVNLNGKRSKVYNIVHLIYRARNYEG